MGDPLGLVVLVTTVVMAGSHHLSGAAYMLAVVYSQPLAPSSHRGVAFTDPHFPAGEVGLSVRAGKHSTQMAADAGMSWGKMDI